MDWQGAVLQLKTQRFGWLTPAGQIVPCTLHNHLTVLGAAGHFAQEIADLADMTPEAVERNCEEMAALHGDANAEWHRLDFAAQDYEIARVRLMDAIYEAGWVRLGLRQDGRGRILDAEGRARGLAGARKHLRDLAASLSATLETREQKAGDGIGIACA